MPWAVSRRSPNSSPWKGGFLVLLGLAFAVAVGGLHVFKPPFLAAIESLVYDTLLRAVARPATSGAVVVVDLDEPSLARFGQWPWPRYRLAALLDQITALGAVSVGVDLVLAEADQSSPDHLEQQWRREFHAPVQIRNLPATRHDHDALLAATLARGPYVLSYSFLYDGIERPATPCLLHPLTAAIRVRPGTAGLQSAFPHASGVVCNLPPLARAAGMSGFFNAVPDFDGRLRRTPVVIRYQDGLYPSLALATFLRARGLRQVMVTLNPEGIESLQVGGRTVPLDAHGNLLLNYRGPRRTFPYLSAADVLLGRVSPEVVRGKIVLVGTSATGLHDLRATPIDAAVPGVEIHATALDNLLQGDFLQVPRYARGLELGLVLLAGLAASLLLAWTGAVLSLALLAAAGVSAWGSCQWLLAHQGVVVSPVPLWLVLAVEFSGLSLTKLWRAERHARQRTRELVLTQDAAIQSLAALGEARDTETGDHLMRTQHYASALARHLCRHPKFRAQLDEATLEALHKMVPLHDVGKIGIRDAILLKPGPLTAEEFEAMKQHTVIAHQIFREAEARLGSNSFLRIADQVAHSHHERWDGTGYPVGLRGEAIPLAGRIMAVVDVYDALISRRTYKPPRTHEEAVTTIVAGRGSHFDPDIVDAFVEIEAEFQRIGGTCADPAHVQTVRDRVPSSVTSR
jgi:CHASE2 domain-containing sensor protein